MSASLSVVMPVYNEAEHLPATIESLVRAVEASSFDAELVLVDDGSTDRSVDVVRERLDGKLALSVVSQPNRGRFAARRAGLDVASADWVLLLDSRVRLDSGALAFVGERIRDDGGAWTGDVDVQTEGNPCGTFWKLLAELAWSDYFAAPRETSFGASEFDRFPKGTGCFLARRELMLEATDSVTSRYENLRRANDDAPLLRWVAERERIHIAPSFRCSYAPRASLAPFVRHALHRGYVFLDGHGRRESAFFPAVVAFYPASAAVVLAALKRPSVVPVALVATSLAAAALGIARRRSAEEIRSLALLAPVYAAAHGLGMWRGLGLIVTRKTRLTLRESADDLLQPLLDRSSDL